MRYSFFKQTNNVTPPPLFSIHNTQNPPNLFLSIRDENQGTRKPRELQKTNEMRDCAMLEAESQGLRRCWADANSTCAFVILLFFSSSTQPSTFLYVDRGLQSPPSPQKQGGGGTLACGWGVGGESQFRRGAYTVVLLICTYFVFWSKRYEYCTAPIRVKGSTPVL